MNITAIRIFLEIVNTHSLSKAAENLYLSQSTVSHHLKAMEAELHSQLIVRHQGQRTIHLTPQKEKAFFLWPNVGSHYSKIHRPFKRPNRTASYPWAARTASIPMYCRSCTKTYSLTKKPLT